MRPIDYYILLKDLRDKGRKYDKTTPRFAFRWPNLRIRTQTSSGEKEVDKEFDHNIYIVADPDAFDQSESYRLMETIIKRFSEKLLQQTNLNQPDFEGPGVWTVHADKFEASYEIKPGSVLEYMPKKDDSAQRLALVINKKIEIPTNWGEPFLIEEGGAIASAYNDLKVINDILEKVDKELSGTLSIDSQRLSDIAPQNDLADQVELILIKHLYVDNNTDHSVLDIYGMEPGFLQKNYEVLESKGTNKAKKIG